MPNDINVNMTPNPLDLQTLHCSQGDTGARKFKIKLHNNGEVIDTSNVKEQVEFPVYKGGTEELLPTNTSTPVTSPIDADIQYPQGLLTDQVFTYRESPTEEDGKAKIKSIRGNTLKWNQLVDTSTTSVTLTSGHKYLTRINGTVSIVSGTGQSLSVTGGTDNVFDLTAMGLDITDPSEFTNLFPLPYYQYDTGSLLSFKGSGIKTSNSTKIYGIRRQISASSPNWERTDDGVGLTANATKDGSSVVNNFDDIYPWSEIKTVNLTDDGKVNAVYGMGSFKWDGSNGEVMTYIPSFWYKRWQESGYEYVQISQSKFDGAEYSKGFYVGRYTTSSGTHSKSGVLSQVSTNITNFRNQAKAKGDGWQQLDYHYCLIELLYLVEYANYNIQATLGNGNRGTSAQIELGGCDSLGMSSGCLADDSAHAVSYRGIENLYGNIWQFIDGVNAKDNQAYINYNQSSYAVDTFDGDYQPLGYINGNANGWQKELGYDADNQAIAFPTAVGGSGTTYMCDYYYQNTGSRIALVGGAWNGGVGAGFSWAFDYASGGAGANVGSRLLFDEENPLLENYKITNLPISTYFPQGMNRVNDVYDELTETKAITRMGVLYLDSVNWSLTSSRATTKVLNGVAKGVGFSVVPNMLSSKYEAVKASVTLQEGEFAFFFNDGAWTLSFYYDGTNKPTGLLYYELSEYEETPITTASLVTENGEIALKSEDDYLVGECNSDISENAGFIDAKVKLSDADGEIYSNKIQIHVERRP